MRQAAIASLLFVAACGPLAEGEIAGQVLQGLGGGDGQAGSISQDPRRALTRDLIEQSPTDLMLFAVVDRDAAATAQKIASNGDKVTWVTLDGISVTIENGVIIATRGLGDDIMAADAADVQRAIANRGGEALRIHDYLGGEDQILRQSFRCSVTPVGRETLRIFDRNHVTTKLLESCVGPSTQFENQYWIDDAGVVWQSRQWVSPLVGALDFQRL